MAAKSGGLPDDDPSFKPPPAFKISRQLDQEKIDYLNKRIEECIKSNNELRSSSSRNEKDTHDIVLYFQREIELKDEIISRLNEDLVKRETQLKFELERMRKKFENDLKEEKSDSLSVIQDLRARLESAEITLVQISSYRIEKEAHDQKFAELERLNEEQKTQMFDALENQERRFLEDKANLIKEQESYMLKFREVAMKEARELMGVEAQKLMANNNHMYEELKFLHAYTAELQAEKTKLEQSLTVTTRDISILADKELEYARQALFKTKEIKTLRERVEHLEKVQVVNIERFKNRTHDIKSAVSKELEESLLDSAALRRLLQIKNKELRKMKYLAVTILSQRSEVEQFFLEALQEVKNVLLKERKKSYQEKQIQASKMRSQAVGGSKTIGKSTLPNIKFQNPAASLQAMENVNFEELQLTKNAKVDVKDLTWSDKELVLRVLFAKMNGLNALKMDGAAVGTKKKTGNKQNTFISQNENEDEEGEGIADFTDNNESEELVSQYGLDKQGIDFSEALGDETQEGEVGVGDK